ncbi:MAG: hypothetical protein GKR90_19560 [Pseudomonadales bacterium]|nr:hypothetical protein [Pseudomonadales bacterium]
MRIFIRFVSFTVAIVLATFVAAYFYLQNTDRLKPDVEALIADQTGVDVKIHGDLRWQLFPPLTLQIEDLEVTDAGRHTRAAALDLKLDLSAMWQDVNKWKVSALQLTNTSITEDGNVTKITQLVLTDFTPGEPASLSIEGNHLTAGEEIPIAGTLVGTITYQPATEMSREAIKLTDTTITSDQLTAVCDIDALDNGSSPPEAGVSDEALLPVATLRGLDVIADCVMTELTVGTETFTGGDLKITNLTDNLNVFAEIKDFLGGSVITEIDVDLAAQPIRWRILPEVDGVDSKRLIDWTNRSVHWVAPLGLTGEITMQGNTEAELMNSISSDQVFDGGQGELDVSALKQQMAHLAAITRSSDSFAKWPDTWVYETFIGKLETRGQNQVLNIQLDNLFIDGEGIYDYTTDKINMLANVTFREAPEGSPYVVNPILQDTPLPMRCSGASQDIKCKLDNDATKTLIASALKSDSDTGLRRKLEKKIDEKVPEEYRDTARSLLDAIGRALDRD